MNDDQKTLLDEIKRHVDTTVGDLRTTVDDIGDRLDVARDDFKRDLEASRDEFKRYLDVTAEGLRGEIRQVAEGVLTVDQKLGRFRGEMDEFRAEVNQRFDDTQAIMRSRSRQNGHHTE